MANTKLSPECKAILKELRENFKGKLKFSGDTTIAYFEAGNTVIFSLAVASPDEKKVRRKVGEYLALTRLDQGQSVAMRSWDFFNMLDDIFFL